ncbi:hypothetical protein ACFX14_042007 [Malus domestica]
MASSDQSRAPPTPLLEQFANSVPHILASLKALEEKESAQQLEIDRLKQERDVLRLKVPHDWDGEREIMDQRVRHFEDLERLTESVTLVAQRVKPLKERGYTLKHDSNENLKMALKQLEEQKRIVLEGENFRKKLHNTIMELKGNIRVFCRVRPWLADEDEAPAVSYPTAIESLGRGIVLLQNGQNHHFTFDRVFHHEASQEDVFVEISELVESALNGYKVCIFAYGQRGSGKTYTMMGRPDAPEQKGLIPRSLEQIFQTSQSLEAKGWTYRMQVSMLEIYNEEIRDLLSTRGADLAKTAHEKQYTIHHDADGNAHVSGLTIVDVSSINQASFLLQQAAHSRSVGKTDMNEQSSRSHFVCTLRISGENENTKQEVKGVLNLIDLAGSERLSRTGATGERLKETQAINKSLLSLSCVMSALANKEDHVPFRNSKLTYLLQPCLGGECKTLMLVNVAQDSSSIGETTCSLRFASTVHMCEGIPRRQMTMKNMQPCLVYRGQP